MNYTSKRFCHQCGTQALTPALFCQSCSAPAYYPPPPPPRPAASEGPALASTTKRAYAFVGVIILGVLAAVYFPRTSPRDPGRQRLEAAAAVICRSLHAKAGLSAATCGVSGKATLVIMHPRASSSLAAASTGAPGFYDAAERAGFTRVSFSDGAGRFTNYDIKAGAFER